MKSMQVLHSPQEFFLLAGVFDHVVILRLLVNWFCRSLSIVLSQLGSFFQNKCCFTMLLIELVLTSSDILTSRIHVLLLLFKFCFLPSYLLSKRFLPNIELDHLLLKNSHGLLQLFNLSCDLLKSNPRLNFRILRGIQGHWSNSFSFY